MRRTTISLPDELKQKAMQGNINVSRAARAGIRACLENPNVLGIKQATEKSLLKEEINRIDNKISSLKREKEKLYQKIERIDDILKNQEKKMRSAGKEAKLMSKLNEQITLYDFKYEKIRNVDRVRSIMKQVKMSDKQLKEHIKKLKTVIQK